MSINDGHELMRRIEIGVRGGAARALAKHKKEGQPIAIMRDGRVVIVPPEEIQVPENDGNLDIS